MKNVLLILICFGIMSTTVFSQGNFKVSIRHYLGGAGTRGNYVVTKDSIKLITDCDFEGCKPTLVYQQELTAEQSQKFYNLLLKQRLDTLQNKYKTTSDIDDGHQASIEISGDKLPTKSIYMDNYFPISAQVILMEADKLIKKKKYKFYHD